MPVGQRAGPDGRRRLLHSLAERLCAHGSDLVVENDANLCAVGEHALGAALGVDVLVCLTVGTGIGMGVLVGGKLFRGAHGAAGEIADLPAGARASGARAHRPGPMEDVASAHAIVARARALGSTARSAREVFRSAAVDPGLIVLGGGIGSNAALLAGPMRRALAATTPFAPEIVAGQLGPEAVLAGAVTTALGTAREMVFERREPRRTAAQA
ncbi:ROK family protein [Amycolatopsis sp. CA-161197]|uniref:ROK family protein n=1 Tax=Amycolatopsis sp. CA-161197 TaxID=3239922 RepID=UPI003D91D111